MPVVFFVDPEIVKPVETKGIHTHHAVLYLLSA
jgi:cytochrome c oxidase assembly protein Cox11